MRVWGAFAGIVTLGVYAYAGQNPTWTLARSAHFEVYSQAGGNSGRAALTWLEQLRSFFLETGLGIASANPENRRPPVRVIGFRSAADYDAYRLRPTADAYYIGTESRDYIVMPKLDPEDFRMAAHEYSHTVFHAAGLHLPPWLNEGLAEFFSTVRIGSGGCELGAAIVSHLQTLRREQWMLLGDLVDLPAESSLQDRRQTTNLFYSQSWAFTHMLLLSDQYASKFHDFVAAVSAGQASSEALTRIYGKPLPAITADLRSWILRHVFVPVTLPGVAVNNAAAEISELSSFQCRSLLAELLSVSGQLDRAEAVYRDLDKERERRGEIAAALGTIALRKGDTAGARQQLKRAVEEGIPDASLCYRYALMAEDAGSPMSETRAALARAIELKPDFDDARYKLALLESSTGDYDAALKNLRAMRCVAPGRAYSYWIAVANDLTELGQREEAKIAAQEAMSHASNPDERASAARVAYIAETDLTVQFARGADGQLQLVTARKRHGASDWNPFIEPGDRILRADGQLRTVECGGGKVTGFSVSTAAGVLTLTIPDPMHLLIRNGPSEFFCGAQSPSAVHIEYAATDGHDAKAGVLRGIEFR